MTTVAGIGNYSERESGKAIGRRLGGHILDTDRERTVFEIGDLK